MECPDHPTEPAGRCRMCGWEAQGVDHAAGVAAVRKALGLTASGAAARERRETRSRPPGSGDSDRLRDVRARADRQALDALTTTRARNRLLLRQLVYARHHALMDAAAVAEMTPGQEFTSEEVAAWLRALAGPPPPPPPRNVYQEAQS